MNENRLVLFKYRLAITQSVGDKIEILFQDGKTRSVREKDISLLSNGDIKLFNGLTSLEGDVETAWELMQGEIVDFMELSELIYGEESPSASALFWELLKDRSYFKYNGDLSKIEVVSEEDYAAEMEKRKAKEEALKRWEEFISLVKSGKFDADYQEFYNEIEQYAYGVLKKSRILSEIGKEQTYENAHRLLLKLGVWTSFNNPYPQRSGLPMQNPTNSVPKLADEERVDLTHLTSYAIDDEGNQDPDDAISIDGDTLWIHVADCAALVPENSELDMLARDRIANQYLPERTVNMLPEELVHQLGLGLQETSPALSIAVKLDEEANVSDVNVVISTVKVTRLTYREADEMISNGSNEILQEMYKVTQKFREKRVQNGAAVIRLPEVRTKVDENNKVTIKPFVGLKSRDLVTDAMLMAGEGIAMFAEQNAISIPYATQQENTALEKVDIDGFAGMFAGRKRFKRSQMKTSPDKHAGLGMDIYTRATSPMRRYLDLVVHQQVRNFITGKEPLSYEDVLERVALSESLSGSIAQSERASNQHWKLVFLEQNPEWLGEAIVVDEYNGSYTLLIPELSMDVKMKFNDPVNLNDTVKLQIKQVNIPELTAQFVIID